MDASSLGSATSLRTRATLLCRIQDWDDSASWSEFYRLYRRLVYGLARRAGLNHDEAQDVIQDVFKRVAETIKDFRPGRTRGSFRSWLMNLTRWRISDCFRERLPRADSLRGDRSGEGGQDRLASIPDPVRDDEQFWEREWQHRVVDTALARLARRVPAKRFQVFQLYACQGWPVFRIARELGLNPATVYLINHRMTRRLKKEVSRLKSQMG